MSSMTAEKFCSDTPLEKLPCSDLNQLRKVFRKPLSFKRNWFHFSNPDLWVFCHLLYNSWKGFKLGWTQSKEGRKEVSMVIGKSHRREPSIFLFKSKVDPKGVFTPKYLKSFLLWIPVALSSRAVLWNLAYCFWVCHFNQTIRLFKADEHLWETLQRMRYGYFSVHRPPYLSRTIYSKGWSKYPGLHWFHDKPTLSKSYFCILPLSKGRW